MANLAKVQTPDTADDSGVIFVSNRNRASEFGQLFMVTHLRTGNSSDTIDELHDYINRLYYSSAKGGPDEALEDVAARLNEELPDLFPKIKAAELVSRLDLLIGVVHETADDGLELHFVKTGAAHLLLQHGLTLMDITAEDAASDEMVEDENFFGAITSGPLTTQDTIIAASASLLDYFSEEKLKQLLKEGSVDSLASDIRNLVGDFTPQTMFQALVIKLAAEAEEPDTAATTRRITERKEHSHEVQASMSGLNDMRAQTDEIMSASLTKRLGRQISSLFQRSQRVEGRLAGQSSSDLAIKRRRQSRSTLGRLGANLLLLFKAIFLGLLWLGRQLYAGLAFVFKNRSTLVPRVRDSLQNLPGKTKRLIKTKQKSYTSMPWTRRLLLTAGVLLAIILLISLASGVVNLGSSKNREAFTLKAAEIEDKRSAADAALIYGDETGAIAMIAEARVLLEELPENPKELREQKAAIAADLFETYKQLQKLEEIFEPVEIADLSITEDGASVNLLALAGTGDVFYGLSDDNKIFEFDIPEQTAAPLLTSEDTINNIFTGNPGQIFAYQSLPEAALLLLDTIEETFTVLDVTFNDVITEKSHILTYFGRLYILDPRNRQIYKHQRVGDTYTRGEAWLNDDSVDLSSATSMAIDGRIWVVTKAGDLFVLNKGEAEELNLDLLDPGLNSPNFIWTDVDSTRLYIMDPPTRRVVILNKDGSIHKQYVSALFDDLRGASVDEANNVIYLLNGSKVFEIAIE